MNMTGWTGRVSVRSLDLSGLKWRGWLALKVETNGNETKLKESHLPPKIVSV